MAKTSQSLAARVTALEKAVAKKLSGGKAAKKSKKTRASADAGKGPEHGIFPDSPPIFAVDGADAEAALGFRHGHS